MKGIKGINASPTPQGPHLASIGFGDFSKTCVALWTAVWMMTVGTRREAIICRGQGGSKVVGACVSGRNSRNIRGFQSKHRRGYSSIYIAIETLAADLAGALVDQRYRGVGCGGTKEWDAGLEEKFLHHGSVNNLSSTRRNIRVTDKHETGS